MERSDHQEFYRNFKEAVAEMHCQTHIESKARELIFDVNSKQVFASVFLSTTHTNIQHTKKMLFRVGYNCDSEVHCASTEFFGVLLDNILPIHRGVLANLMILFPLEAIQDSAIKAVQVTSHSQDACGGHYSSYSFATGDIRAKLVSSKHSHYCYTQGC